MNQPVAVTGAGVVSCIGTGQDRFAAALFENQLRPGQSEAAAVRDFDPQPWLGARGWRGLDRSALMYAVASFMALQASGFPERPGTADYPDVGLFCGTMFGSLGTIASFDRSVLEEGPNLVRPIEFANAAINSCTDQAAIRLRLRGLNSTLSAGFASGLAAVEHATHSVRLGRARAVLAGGVEALCEEIRCGFADAGLLSRSGAGRPFAAGRDGVVLGEGSAVLMLETEGGARSRGLAPPVRISGTGVTHSPRPEPAGAAEASAIRRAVASAGIGPEDIACIISSGNGSPEGDRAEALALASVFGRRLGEIPACAPKGAFGECLGASGALLALVAVVALDRRLVPPTPGACENEFGLRLSTEPQKLEGTHALVNASGCGNHVSIVVKSN